MLGVFMKTELKPRGDVAPAAEMLITALLSEFPEYTAVNDSPAIRTCLSSLPGCEQAFLSTGPNHRRCMSCKEFIHQRPEMFEDFEPYSVTGLAHSIREAIPVAME